MVMGDTGHNVGIRRNACVSCNACAYARRKACVGYNAGGGVGRSIDDVG